jgi:hypothetical protein
MRMSAAQLTEEVTRAQLQAEIYRQVANEASVSALGRLGRALPALLLPPAPAEPPSPAQFCLYEDCPSSDAPPLQQRRCRQRMHHSTLTAEIFLRKKSRKGALQ